MTTTTEPDGPEMTEPTTERAPSPYAPPVAKQIRIHLAMLDRTSVELAGALALHPNTLSRRMVGHADWSLPELVAVARFCGVPLSTIAPDSLVDLAPAADQAEGVTS